jgi:predicted transposase YbfD/YdcC
MDQPVTARGTANAPVVVSTTSIIDHFASLPDPRVNRTRRHLLADILVIALCAVIAGADDFVAIAAFGRARETWFRERLGLRLPAGIPSHDTFARLLARLNPEKFERAFLDWIDAVHTLLPGEHIVLDGKSLRHSFDTAWNQGPLHMVSAWATSARVVLGQMATEEKSNEISAIPDLLGILDIQGCLISIDAMGCQKQIAAQIVEQGADYVLAVKGNQPALLRAIQLFFEHADETRFEACPYRHSFTESIEFGHGRKEVRRCWLAELKDDLAWHDDMQTWAGLGSIGRVESERTVCTGSSAKTTKEVRYYICSFTGRKATARRLARAVRAHWQIENRCHWVLDMSFAEDASRVRRDHAPENLAIMRRIALNLLTHETTAKCGVKNRRLTAGWDTEYLAKVLLQ